MPAGTQQPIAPVGQTRLVELLVDELNQEFPSPLNALRQSQNISGNKPKQGLAQGIGLATVSEKTA